MTPKYFTFTVVFSAYKLNTTYCIGYYIIVHHKHMHVNYRCNREHLSSSLRAKTDSDGTELREVGHSSDRATEESQSHEVWGSSSDGK